MVISLQGATYGTPFGFRTFGFRTFMIFTDPTDALNKMFQPPMLLKPGDIFLLEGLRVVEREKS
jgi:hypothetical protein